MQSKARLPLFLGLSLGWIAACAPQVPDSGASYAAREAELSGGVASAERLTAPDPVSSAPLGAAGTVSTLPTGTGVAPDSPEGIAAETAAVLASSSTTVPGQTPVVASSGLSVENDFSAVSENRTIQSDAALIAENRARYEVIEPTALPSRSGGSQPNIVAYALSSSHPRGTQLYTRVGINLQARSVRKCADYASADLAQIDFLAKGGPERDRIGLDPDGDGYACTWDPAPFRRAQNG